jgi:hypothetical protein
MASRLSRKWMLLPLMLVLTGCGVEAASTATPSAAVSATPSGGELQQHIPFGQCFGFDCKEHLREYVHQQFPIGNRRYRSPTEVETLSNEKKEMDILKSRRTNPCFFIETYFFFESDK